MKIKTKFVMKTYTMHSEIRQFKKQETIPFGYFCRMTRTSYEVATWKEDTGYTDLYITEMEPKQIKAGEKFFIQTALIPSLGNRAFTIHDVWEQEESQIFVVEGSLCTNVVESENEKRELKLKAEILDRPLRIELEEKIQKMREEYQAEQNSQSQKTDEAKRKDSERTISVFESEWEDAKQNLSDYADFINFFLLFGSFILFSFSYLTVAYLQNQPLFPFAVISNAVLFCLIVFSIFKFKIR